MCIVSSVKDKAIPNDTVFVADVGLTGELKKVPSIEARIREIDRMGFKRVYIAKNTLRDSSRFKNLEIIELNTLYDVILDLNMKAVAKTETIFPITEDI